jgi:dihydrofolate reductase
MRVCLIWAMTKNRVIGRNNQLPWHLPDEMRHFMRTTLGKPVIMGRKQFQSMGKPLPNRANVVLSRNPDFAPDGVAVVSTLDDALAYAEAVNRDPTNDEIMVIGGAEIYAQALPRADRLYCTVIDAELDGDTFFPEFDLSRWHEVRRTDHPADARHAYGYSVQVLERV